MQVANINCRYAYINTGFGFVIRGRIQRIWLCLRSID